MPKASASDIFFLQMAIRHETAMSKLYRVLADKVPCSRKMWSEISKDEFSHAARLQTLQKEIKAGNASLDPKRHSADVIYSSLQSLDARVTSWGQWGVEQTEAFQYALLLEGGIIEQRIFIPQGADSELTQQIFFEMQTGTSHHMDRIQGEYEKHNPSAGFLRHFRARMKGFFTLD